MTPRVLRHPPSPFPNVNVHVVDTGTAFHRTHARTLRPAQFNPCLGQPTRFASIRTAAGACIHSLYAATNREAAAFESIFHDIEASARFKTVRLADVEARSVSRIAPIRALRLAALFTPDLKAWGLRRADLIDTSKSAYARTARWAEAIHAARSDLDGLVWTSRQCDPAQCVVLFGSRIIGADFDVLDRREAYEPAILLELRNHGARAGITII